MKLDPDVGKGWGEHAVGLLLLFLSLLIGLGLLLALGMALAYVLIDLGF